MIFQLGKFTLASGRVSDFKIDCDALNDADWKALAWLVATRYPPFGKVEGVPRGGLPFAEALQQYCHPESNTLLIADDVLTTGGSMEKQRAGRDAIGIVVFSRAKIVPQWINFIFCSGWDTL